MMDKHEDLIRRLRSLGLFPAEEAADAINALVKERDAWKEQFAVLAGGPEAQDYGKSMVEVIAELAAARAALRFYADPADYVAPFVLPGTKLYLDCGQEARNGLGDAMRENVVDISAIAAARAHGEAKKETK